MTNTLSFPRRLEPSGFRRTPLDPRLRGRIANPTSEAPTGRGYHGLTRPGGRGDGVAGRHRGGVLVPFTGDPPAPECPRLAHGGRICPTYDLRQTPADWMGLPHRQRQVAHRGREVIRCPRHGGYFRRIACRVARISAALNGAPPALRRISRRQSRTVCPNAASRPQGAWP